MAAAYDYDPFGNTLKAVGPSAARNLFRFGGQYTGDENDWKCSRSSPNVRKGERVNVAPADDTRLPDYDRTLAQALLVRAAERKGRPALLTLLSAKCPQYVPDLPGELFLTANTRVASCSSSRVTTAREGR